MFKFLDVQAEQPWACGDLPMYVHSEKLKDGTIVYRFTYFKDGKRIRVPVKDHPQFDTLAAAKAWAKTQTAHHSMMKARIEKRLSWEKKYYNFAELLKKFENYYKNKAPNSYTSTIRHLKNHIFPFFLNEKNANNLNMWHLLLPEFRDWLGTATSPRGKQKPLAANTKNNIIIAYNAFFSWLSEYNHISTEAFVKGKAIPEHLLNKRSYKDVISIDEMRAIYTRMEKIHKPAAEFFYVLWFTGMRFSELFGLPMTSLFRGKIPNTTLMAEMEQHGMHPIGYIYLDSQPYHDDCRREEDGSLKRKPLKSHREISAKHARIIPIEDRDLWNLLARRHKQAQKDFEAGKYNNEKINYRLFDDLESNRAGNTLREAYKDLGITPKSYHCCRHSFVTYLVGRTRSFFLVRAITGHRKDRSFERYLHIYEEMNIQASAAIQDIDEIG